MNQHIIEETVRIKMDWSMQDLLAEIERMEEGSYELINKLREKHGSDDAVKLKSGIIYEIVNEPFSGWMLKASALIDLSDEVPVEST